MIVTAFAAAAYAALLGGNHMPISADAPGAEEEQAPVVTARAEAVPRLVLPGESQQRLTALSASSPADAPAVAPTAVSALAATPTATPAAKEDCDIPPGHTLYCIYTVKAGDSLSAIAMQYGIKGGDGVSAADVLAQSNKPDVVHSDQIVPGQKLRVPVANGVIHTVFAAQTLAQVASQYGVTAEQVMALGSNGISDPAVLVAGREVLIPDPKKLPAAAGASAPDTTPTPTAVPPTATPTPSPVPTEAPSVNVPPAIETPAPAAAQLQVTPTPRPSTPTVTSRRSTPTATATPVRTPTPSQELARSQMSSAGFIWPATGPISSYYGPRHPLGIDIDFYADPTQPIIAAAAGTVTFAGGDACCSYGFYVIIDHGNGFTTLYAHLSRIAVSVGQRVPQGLLIGYGGSTGYATGNHLHFEVHKDDVVVNPLSYLP